MPKTNIGHLTVSSVPQELSERMRQIAERNYSSLSAEVRRAMAEHVAREIVEPTKATA